MSSDKTTQIITIDGPAGAGKSTVAKILAEKLSLSYLDTGAMYRALALKAMRANIDLENESALVAMAKETKIDLINDNANVKVMMDGDDVTDEIRTIEVTNNTFYVAQKPGVRKVMVQWQREIGGHQSVVVEGRDLGTVVFPQADYKFYLDANLDERSRRRVKELQENGTEVEPEQLTAELKDRDNKDLTRGVGPLKKADDAILIDSTNLSIEGVIEEMMKYINSE